MRLYLQYGDTILIHAVKGNHLDIVRALLKKYADVDVQGVVSLLVPYSDFHVLFCNVQLQDFFYLQGAVHNTQILQPTSTGSGFDLAWFGSRSSEHRCIFSPCGAVYT